jgi:hypothetical protein
MKRLLIAITTFIFLSFFNDCFAQAKKTGTNMDNNYPYTATYSSSFTMGKSAYAAMILDLWKDWDDNKFERHDYMADSVVMMFPNGAIAKGKEANMAAAKQIRGSMASVKSIVHAWIPITSTDKNEDIVCIWGQEEDTLPDGKVEKKDVHEVWWFNKDGKITSMRQWTAKFGE